MSVKRPQNLVSLFQFHKGTIKAFDFEAREHGLIIFQFHKGTIKAEVVLAL